MDSEPEPDTVEAPAVPNEPPPPPPPKKRPGPPRKEPAVPKRDPNERITENWQRRSHVADRMDAPKSPAVLKDDRDEPKEPKEPGKPENGESSSEPKAEKPVDLDHAIIDTPNYTFARGEYVFVYTYDDACTADADANAKNSAKSRDKKSHDNMRISETWDEPLPALRIGRIAKIRSASELVVNWSLRPEEVMRSTSDSRESYLSYDYADVELAQIRGKCVVQHVHEIRTLARFREKAAQFYFTKSFDRRTAKSHDVVLTSSLRTLVGAAKADSLQLAADYAVVSSDVASSLSEMPRSKRSAQPDLEEEDVEEHSTEELAKLTSERSYEPFRFWDRDSGTWTDRPKPGPKTGTDYQIDIDEWPGAPLVYYTYTAPTPQNPERQIRLVEQSLHDDEPEADIDVNEPWVQEMPSGYLPRGGEATSTPLSSPIAGIHDFVSRCQDNYAQQSQIPKHNLNFSDACCSAYTQGGQSRESSVEPSPDPGSTAAKSGGIDMESRIESASLAVSRLSKRTLIPELTSVEYETLSKLMSPFLHRDWHAIYRAIGSKPFQESCSFYWSQSPLAPKVPVSQMASQPADLKPASRLCCVECHTHQAPEWKVSPRAVFVAPNEIFVDKRLALCSRCARLWYRYRTGWKACSEIDPENVDPAEIEPELLEDAQAYLIEQERRSKRRHTAAEKREATAKKRNEEKEAKREAKRSKKEKKGATDEPVKSETGETGEQKPSADSSKPASSVVDENSSEKKSSDKKDADRKTKGGAKPEKKSKKKADSKTDAKSAESKKNGAKDDTNLDDDDSTTEESDSGMPKQKKRSGALDTQLSSDLVDEILASIDEELEPENSDTPRPCPVCGQSDPSMPQSTCASCMLSVHSACYGSTLAQQSQKSGNDVWFCDCCLNARGKQPYILDVDYECDLCPPRSPEYAVWQHGIQTANAPDSLKPTLDKKWCHLRCAIFNPQISFADPSGLKGINTLAVKKSPAVHPCEICAKREAVRSGSHTNNITDDDGPEEKTSRTIYLVESDQSRPIVPPQRSVSPFKSMGATIKCEYCDSYFHVTCAADNQYMFGSQKNNSKAVVICSEHLRVGAQASNFDLTPFSKIDMNLNMTALQLFVTKHKMSKHKHISGQDRVRIFEENELTKQDFAVAPPRQLMVHNGTIDLMPPILRCVKCGTDNSSYWHEVADGSEKDALCSWCYRGYTHNAPDSAVAGQFWSLFYQRVSRFQK